MNLNYIMNIYNVLIHYYQVLKLVAFILVKVLKVINMNVEILKQNSCKQQHKIKQQQQQCFIISLLICFFSFIIVVVVIIIDYYSLYCSLSHGNILIYIENVICIGVCVCVCVSVYMCACVCVQVFFSFSSILDYLLNIFVCLF